MLDINPQDLLIDGISALFIISSIILGILIAKKSYNRYKKNKITQTLIFTYTALFLAIAMALLICEQVFLAILEMNEIGLFFGNIATIVSGIVVVFIDAFAFNFVFTKRYKSLTVISAIFMSLPVIFHVFDATKYVSEGEIVFTWNPLGTLIPITPLIMYSILVPLLIIPVLTFFYYSMKIRSQSTTRSNRAFFLGLGIGSISMAYIFELVGLPIIIVFFRSFFIIGGLFIYYAMFKIKEKE